jgi:hypothetical protein
LPDDDWGVQIYTVNTDTMTASPVYTGELTASMASGLVASSDTTTMLPMCWRVTDKVLPYAGTGDPVSKDYNKTLSIGANAGGMYDAGTDDPDTTTYYSWFAMKDKAMFDLGDPYVQYGADYLQIWNKKGFHSASGDVNYWGMQPNIDFGFMIKPRVYFGADFSMANTPMIYETNAIIIELYHE